jgi:hypothetical protein
LQRAGRRALTAPLLAVGLLLALGVGGDTRRVELGCGADVRLAHDWLEPSPRATAAATPAAPGRGGGGGVPPELRGHTFPPDVDEILTVVHRRFTDVFTGLSLDGNVVVVHRVPREGSQLDKTLSRRFPGGQVRFADTALSELELHTLQNRVVDDLAYWRDRGVNVRGVGVDITVGRVTVGVVEPASGVPRRLAARYGPAVRVTAAGPVLCFSPAAMAPPVRRAMVVGAVGSPDRHDSS